MESQTGQELARPPSKTRLSLRLNFSWTIAGNLMYTACQWAMLSVLAKLGTREVVGRFSLALAVATPVILFACLNMRMVQATDARTGYTFKDYLRLRAVLLVFACVVIAAFAGCSHFRPADAAVLGAVTLAKVFDALSDVIYGHLQFHERMDRIAISRIIQGVTQLLALGIAFHNTHDLFTATLCLAAVSGLVTAGYDVPSALWITRITAIGGTNTGGESGVAAPRRSLRALTSLAGVCLPLGLVAVLGAYSTNVPRYFIASQLGAAPLGVFSAMAYLVAALGMVYGSLVQAALPRLSKYYTEDLGSFKRLLLKLTLIGVGNGVCGMVVVAVAGRTLVSALYKPQYATSPDTFLLLALGATLLLTYSALSAGLTAARSFRAQPAVVLGQCVITAGGCAALVPRFGLAGAALGMICGFLFCLFSFGVLVRQALHRREHEAPGADFIAPAKAAIVQKA